MVTIYSPNTLNKRGSDLSGADGASNRTIDITTANFVSAGLDITINGTQLINTVDFTVGGVTITFINAVDNTDYIRINYFTTYSSSLASIGSSATYATPLQLAQFMFIEGKIPDITATGGTRGKENVGTGDNSNTLFYLDKAYVIDRSYTLYYGATSATTTELTEDTHYTIDLDTGSITLTAAGVTLLSTNILWAVYSYTTIQITNTILQTALNAAQDEIDRRTNTHFAVATDTTPDWTKVTEESHIGLGFTQKDYFLSKLPLADVSTTLDGAVTAGDATITVVSTAGFPTTGFISIGSDKITYSGKTATTFTGCSGATAHATGLTVNSFVIEISSTVSGSTPVFTVLEKDVDYDIDLTTGKVHLYKDDYYLVLLDNAMPQRGVPNRFRASYLSGESTIPSEINRVCKMIASEELMHGAVRKATATGNNSFNPTLIDVEQSWIDSIIERYTVYGILNT